MLSSINKFKFISRVMTILVLGSLLAGCPQHIFDQSSEISQEGQVLESSAYYLGQMNNAFGSSKNSWRLLAIEALLQEGNWDKAENMLQTSPDNLTFEQKQQFYLLNTELYLHKGELQVGQRELAKLHYNQLSSSQQQRFLQAKIGLYGDDPLEQLRAYIELEKLGDDNQRKSTIDETWKLLSGLSRQQLNSFVINANEYTLQGWLDLLRIKQDNKDDLEQLKNAVAEWQVRYAENPAAKYLPRHIFSDDDPIPQEGIAVKTALLLPLTGPSQMLGEAIEAGFKAAAQPVSEPGSTALANLKVYDTNAKPMPALLEQVKHDGAQLIVGPLIKNDVEELQKLSPQIPVLALNQSSMVDLSHHICYFALAPEDEAQSAAKVIHEQNKKQPLLLVPHNELGQRVVTAFATAWNQLSGDGLYVQYLPDYQQLKELMNKGIGIKLTGSFMPGSALVDAASQPQPIDAVYVVANQDELTLIKPMLDMISEEDKANKLINNTVAPPIYASSRSHSSEMGTDFRHEMEGVQFSEIPFLAKPELQLPDSIRNDYRLVRLYAMGMDALHLAQNYSSLTIPDYHFHGKTGDLVINNGCVIKLKPTWLKYQEGQIVPLAENAD